MSYTVVENRKAWDAFMLAAKRDIKGVYVKVGFPAEGHVASPTLQGSKHKPITTMAQMAKIAAVQEFGSRSGRIPARSFMRRAIISSRKALPRVLDRAAMFILTSGYTPERAMKDVGDYMTKAMQAAIHELRTPPLKPRTIARKHSKVLLIDRGQMINSIQHVVVK